MLVLHKIFELRKFVDKQKSAGKKIGFVPTMGALHEGHLSLIRKSRKDNPITLASIFVNPQQFNDKSDYQKYPRTEESDLTLLKKEGCSAVFCPDEKTIYPESPALKFSFGSLEDVMEGAHRPGHFNGVALVVSKLFNLVTPDSAYFGQKDLQQFLIIKRMVADLGFNIKLICCPIMRNTDGLALSSRNVLLSQEERKAAPELFKGLCNARNLLMKGKSIGPVKKTIRDTFRNHPFIRLQYFEIADSKTLAQVKNINPCENVALCIAAYLGNVRLIDNVFLR